ncbi:MAG: hypothetical protein IPL61_22920 [Myxococcales bacterium]|nr:hypothetical protein [Myxococcales bacterium]
MKLVAVALALSLGVVACGCKGGSATKPGPGTGTGTGTPTGTGGDPAACDGIAAHVTELYQAAAERTKMTEAEVADNVAMVLAECKTSADRVVACVTKGHRGDPARELVPGAARRRGQRGRALPLMAQPRSRRRVQGGSMIRVSSVIVIALAVAACGGSHPAPSSPDEPAPPPDRRTELERRRDAACEALGPRMTDCAIADARATMSPEELAKLEIESTAPVHTKKFVESCQAQSLSSRQVRVYEVCLREEQECDPLIACLDNARPDAATP